MKFSTVLSVAVAAALLIAGDSLAGRRGSVRYSGGWSGGQCGAPITAAANPIATAPAPIESASIPIKSTCDPNANCAASVPTQSAAPTATSSDPLAQVNARRSAAGLRPYILDPGLTQAATACVQYRARLRIRGHVTGGMGDFQFLPAGVRATAAGADGPGATSQFLTCAMTDNYTYAGAASAVGPDGQWYHQLFVR